MRLPLWPITLLLVTGCDSGIPAGQEPGGPARTDRPPVSESSNGAANATSAEAGALPPQNVTPRFVGRWAADLRSCQSKAWQFTATALQTPAGSNCGFNRVSQVPGGYDIEATCTAEGPPQSETLKIRFAESAQAMLLSSKTLADTGLVFCGDEV